MAYLWYSDILMRMCVLHDYSKRFIISTHSASGCLLTVSFRPCVSVYCLHAIHFVRKLVKSLTAVLLLLLLLWFVLCSNVLWPCRQISILSENILLSVSTLKIQTVCSSKTLTVTYKSARRYNRGQVLTSSQPAERQISRRSRVILHSYWSCICRLHCTGAIKVLPKCEQRLDETNFPSTAGKKSLRTQNINTG